MVGRQHSSLVVGKWKQSGQLLSPGDGSSLQAKSSGTDLVRFGCEEHPQRAEVLLFLCAQELLGREPCG